MTLIYYSISDVAQNREYKSTCLVNLEAFVSTLFRSFHMVPSCKYYKDSFVYTMKIDVPEYYIEASTN